MIKKLYDFRQTAIADALLQAEVTRDEIDGELHLAAARFTTIEAVDGPIRNGDVVALEFADSKQPDGIRRVYANVGKNFDDMEALLPGLCLGDAVQIRYAGKDVDARIVSVKRHSVPEMTDDLALQLGIEHVTNLAQLEDYLFAKLAEGQRKRKFRGIMGLVSKAMMENTEFAELEESHPWYQALHGHMMGRVEAFAAREGITADEALPTALGMDGKPLDECRQALKKMCVERARQAALGHAYAQETGVQITGENTAELIGEYVDYLNQVVYAHFAPQIRVDRK